MYRFHLQHVK